MLVGGLFATYVDMLVSDFLLPMLICWFKRLVERFKLHRLLLTGIVYKHRPDTREFITWTVELLRIHMQHLFCNTLVHVI